MMQHDGHTSECSNEGTNNKLEKAKNNFLRVLWNKFANNILIVKGKHMGRDGWGKLLVDWGKKEQFLEICQTGSLMDVADYGKVLEHGFDDNVPSYTETLNQFFDTFYENFWLIKLKTEGCAKTYYVMSGDGSKHEIRSAFSVEEIRRYGRILYSSSDEDPPESLIHVIEEEYFGLAEHNRIIDSKPFEAVRKGELQKVTKYLAEGGDVDSTDEHGWTLLHHAAHCGNMDIIGFLKDKGANVQIQDKMCGRKPVHIAAREGHATAISFFLKNGASVDECDKNKWTLLHYAAWKGDSNTVSFLIQHGAYIHAKEASGSKMPIHVAAEYGHIDVVKLLLENSADIEGGDECGRTPLYYPAWTGHLKTAKFLIQKGAEINVKTEQGKTLLHAAALVNCKENTEFFIDAGLNIDAEDINGVTPIIYAAQNGNFDVVQVLVCRGANFNAINKNCEAHFDYIGRRYVNIILFLTDKICQMFQKQKKYQDALQVYKKTLEIIDETLGQEHLKTLVMKNKVGMTLYELGQYDDAVATFKDVLEKRERCLGFNHYDTLCTKHELGLVYNAQINYSQALEILKDVFEKRQTSLGADHDDTLNVSRDIGNVHFKKGEYEEAYKIFKDVFEKRSTHFGIDDPKTLQVRQDMAVVLVNKGDYKVALRICKEILEKRKVILGNNHPDTLITLHHVTLISQKFEKELHEQNTCSIQ